MRALICVVLLASCAVDDPAPCAPSGALSWWHPVRWPLDVLVVMGDSQSPEEHARRAAEIARLLEIQLSGDLDGDGIADFVAPDDVHIGVISTHLGSGGVPIAGCEPYEGGDGAVSVAACGSTPFLALRADRGESSAAVLDAFECLLQYEPSCQIEQPLEAAMQALQRADGFLRDDSRLTILVATTRDDCSVADPRLYSLVDPGDAGSAEIACALDAPEALHPIERYVEAFLPLRPGLVSFVTIGGVPEDLVPDVGARPDWDRLVSTDLEARDDRMEPTLAFDRLGSSCESSLGARALPPVRLVELARALERAGANVTVESVCRDRFESVFPRSEENPRTICLGSPLPLRADGGAACTVDLVMPQGIACDDTAGAIARGATQDGRAICEWTQLVPSDADRAMRRTPEGAGWFADDYTTSAQRECAEADYILAFSFTAAATPHAEARFRCDVDPPSERPCDACPDACDPVTELCGVPCVDDVHCAIAGLPDHVCDDRWLHEIDPVRFPDDATDHDFCVPATCD